MNIAEILRNCPKGTKLYSSIFGEVELLRVDKHSITCMIDFGAEESFQSDGKYMARYPDAECVLFPSKDQRDWSKFGATDKETKCKLKPFDRVLVRDYDSIKWKCDLFSYKDIESRYVCVGSSWRQCIPYEGNEHLLGTTNKQQ